MALTTDLVSYYKLDDALATTNVLDAHDSNDATLVGKNTDQVDVAGKINTGLDMEASEYINVPIDPSGSTSFTVTMWVKSTSVTHMDAAFSLPGGTGEITIRQDTGTGNRYRIAVYDGTTTNYGYLALTTGTWQFLAITFDSSGYLLYGDGNDLASDEWTGQEWGSSSSIRLGARRDSTGNIDAIFDEVGIWSRKLSEAELDSVYNSGDGLAYPFTSPEAAPIKIFDVRFG